MVGGGVHAREPEVTLSHHGVCLFPNGASVTVNPASPSTQTGTLCQSHGDSDKCFLDDLLTYPHVCPEGLALSSETLPLCLPHPILGQAKTSLGSENYSKPPNSSCLLDCSMPF